MPDGLDIHHEHEDSPPRAMETYKDIIYNKDVDSISEPEELVELIRDVQANITDIEQLAKFYSVLLLRKDKITMLTKAEIIQLEEMLPEEIFKELQKIRLIYSEWAASSLKGTVDGNPIQSNMRDVTDEMAAIAEKEFRDNNGINKQRLSDNVSGLTKSLHAFLVEPDQMSLSMFVKRWYEIKNEVDQSQVYDSKKENAELRAAIEAHMDSIPVLAENGITLESILAVAAIDEETRTVMNKKAMEALIENCSKIADEVINQSTVKAAEFQKILGEYDISTSNRDNAVDRLKFLVRNPRLNDKALKSLTEAVNFRWSLTPQEMGVINELLEKRGSKGLPEFIAFVFRKLSSKRRS